MGFLERLAARVAATDSLLCVGLDSDVSRLPDHLPAKDRTSIFNKEIADATHESVCAYKLNSAFYEAEGVDGLHQLKLTFDYLKDAYGDIPLILDYKRADIGNTNEGYTSFAFDYLGADAVTVNPYLGAEALRPFLDRADKGVIILCRTSNPGGGEFQDLDVGDKKLYEIVANKVKDEWNTNNNCLLVVGATRPEELSRMRRLMGEDFVFLVPGVGAQGGDVNATVRAGINKDSKGVIINSSRDIIFASSGEDFAQAARAKAAQTRDLINKARKDMS